MTHNQAPLRGRIGISGVLLVERQNGETVEIEVKGSAPLATALGITEQEALEVVRQHQQQEESMK